MAEAFNSNYSLGVRQYVAENFANETGWLISDQLAPGQYHQELRRSVFCLAPAGWELWCAPQLRPRICLPTAVTLGFLQYFLQHSIFTFSLYFSLIRVAPMALQERALFRGGPSWMHSCADIRRHRSPL